MAPLDTQYLAPPAGSPELQAYEDAWQEIHSLRPGQQVEYHRGLLIRDRQSDTVVDGWARAFLEAAADGLGSLSQQRIDEKLYVYVFRKSGTPAESPVK